VGARLSFAATLVLSIVLLGCSSASNGLEIAVPAGWSLLELGSEQLASLAASVGPYDEAGSDRALDDVEVVVVAVDPDGTTVLSHFKEPRLDSDTESIEASITE
jgi:hypothetical protein